MSQKLRIKLLEMVKDMKIKHSVSSPQNYGMAFFFSKKFMGRRGEEVYIGSNIRSCKEGREVSQMHFLVI